MNEFGFLTMAFGPRKYFDQAENLALSLRRHMPGIPIAVVTDRADSGPLFDVNVPMHSVAVAGTVHKVDLYRYSPFARTLFIDSDCIVTRPFPLELAQISKFDFTPCVSQYLIRGQSDAFLIDLDKALDGVGGERFPKFNGGVYFFVKGDTAQNVFRRAHELRSEASRLGIKSFDRAGPGDETLIGLALAELRISQLYDDRGKLMRTPLGINGKLRIDALGGGCSFDKAGETVSPAICHFCGDWVGRPEYGMAAFALRNGRKPNPLFRAAAYGRYYVARWPRRLASAALRMTRCAHAVE